MSEEVKKYLDSANFKFKDVDEEGNEVELTLSEEMESLINNNKMLANIVIDLQERIDKAVGIANERINYYNHINNKEHLEEWEELFNALIGDE